MEKYLLLLVATLSVATSNIKPYRTDYTYNVKTDAFYKLHIEQRRSWMIRDICEEEGSKLMEPLLPEDIAQLHGMMKRYPDIGDYVWVEDDGRDHTASDEEVALIDLTSRAETSSNRGVTGKPCIVMTRNGNIEDQECYKQLPFICKVDAKDAPYNSRCGVFGRNYQYEPSVGSCYRVSTIPYSWDEAYAECRAEKAHLVVINSEAEREVVHRILQAAPRVARAQAWFFYFAGFRAEEPVGDAVPVFKTVFNQTLEEAGCADWSTNEPNNAQHNEYCGTIFVNDGKFNDVKCSHKYGFVCEKEVNQ